MYIRCIGDWPTSIIEPVLFYKIFQLDIIGHIHKMKMCCINLKEWTLLEALNSIIFILWC